MSRILLLLPTTSWRAQALLAGARDLGLDVLVGTDRPLIWSERVPDRTITLDFARPEESARRVAELARTRPIHAVVGADDETGVLGATIAMALGQPHNPIAALQAARDKLR
ncbi:MAG TPA: biotin carboxylase, partial [Candidatus Eisenbacteria bacterium]|nr:biotin carboxylase [Candidatus Eisenbacteria bacterium]